MSPIRLLQLLALTLLLAACARDPAALAPAQRPLAAELPAAERSAQRELPLAESPNFRDLGGYRTSDGRTVRWGQLYRSAALNTLSADDQQFLLRLNLQRIVDFRLPEEAANAPDLLPAQLADRHVSMPVGFNGQQDYAKFVGQVMRGDTGGLDLDQLLVATNRQLVEEFTPVFRTWLHGLLDNDSGAQVFHCTAGKDRTGFASAVFLLALGVPQDTVMADYLASNDYLKDKNQKILWKMRLSSLFRADTDGIRPLLGVDARYLNEAFAAMTQHYGSVDNYLREGLGVDDDFRARLRERYLEPQ